LVKISFACIENDFDYPSVMIKLIDASLFIGIGVLTWWIEAIIIKWTSLVQVLLYL